jgi:hypothetical protein
MPASYDVYLVLHRFRDNVDRYRVMVGALRPVGAEYLPRAEIYYQASTDSALLVLCFSPHAVMHLGEDSLHLLAHRSRLPMIVPTCLCGEERRRFFLEQLSDYELHLASGSAGEPGAPAERGPAPAERGPAERGPAERVIDLLTRRIPVLADAMADRERSPELPLFQPWWQRPSSPDLSSN